MVRIVLFISRPCIQERNPDCDRDKKLYVAPISLDQDLTHKCLHFGVVFARLFDGSNKCEKINAGSECAPRCLYQLSKDR